MSAFHFPFRSFPDQCYRIEEGASELQLEIQDLRPVDPDYWLRDETARLNWQFQHLKKSREEKAAAMMDANENTSTERRLLFPLFPLLPAEIRLEIWEVVSGGYERQRIHRINGRPDTPLEYMSNQPMSPLLSICAESRHEYLNRSGLTFAFETYVSYSRDIFYFVDTNSKEDFQRLATFFNHEAAKPILRVALRHALLQHVYDLIPERMNQVAGMLIVWEEWDGWETMWESRDVVFKGIVERRGAGGGETVLSMFRNMIEGRRAARESESMGGEGKIEFSIGTVEEGL